MNNQYFDLKTYTQKMYEHQKYIKGSKKTWKNEKTWKTKKTSWGGAVQSSDQLKLANKRLPQLILFVGSEL